jgi:predicted dehydrogenase
VVGGGSGPSAEATARELGFARFAPSPESVIADEAVDALVVATRHGSHAELVVQALSAGKSVFCEKPVALTARELADVVEAAGRSRGILAVGFNRRFSPLLRELREFVRADSARIAATYRVNAGALEKEHWTHDLDQGGGRALGEVCHFVDTLAFLVGRPVVQVYAAGYGAADAPIQARDNLVVTLLFAEGSVATVMYTADGSPRVPKERLEVFSGRRAAILDDYRSLELNGPSETVQRGDRRQEKGHRQEIEAFVRGVERGGWPVPLEAIANVTLATLAVVESLRTGRPVHVGEAQP